jgi:hypothetical protein
MKTSPLGLLNLFVRVVDSTLYNEKVAYFILFCVCRTCKQNVSVCLCVCVCVFKQTGIFSSRVFTFFRISTFESNFRHVGIDRKKGI